MWRTARVVAALIGIAAVILVAEPLVKVVEFRDLLLEKRGRIMDAATGRGLPDVSVMINWTSGGYGVAGSFGGCDLQRVAITDADGDYTIPNVYGAVKFQRIWWKKLLAPLLGMSSPGIGYHWSLVAFKPGYVRVGDEGRIHNAAAADHQPDRSFPFYWNAPPYQAEPGGLQIEPIALRHSQLSQADEIIYDFALYMRSTCSGFPPVRSAMKRSVRELLCSLPETQPLDPQVVNAFSTIEGDADFFGRMKGITGTELWLSEKQPAGLLCRTIGGREQGDSD